MPQHGVLTGAKLKDGQLTEKMIVFWKHTFCKIYPDLLDAKGLSVTLQLLANQMFSCITVDTKTHFKSRFVKMIIMLLRRQEGEQDVPLAK